MSGLLLNKPNGIGFLTLTEIRMIFNSIDQTWHQRFSDDNFYQELSLYSRIKRFLEKFRTDKSYRSDIINNINNLALSEFNFDPNLIRPLWDNECTLNFSDVSKFFPLAYKYYYNGFDAIINKLKAKSKYNIYNSLNKSYLAWRERQINRLNAQLPRHITDSISHSFLCLELSTGCSVGCWFCGLSASDLEKTYTYEDNVDEWRQTLKMLVEIFGSDTFSSAFCYSATDPFDNPDYELFCDDYFYETGYFPRTTTALAHTNTKRTRQLLQKSTRKGCLNNRLSILSLRQLEIIHQEFTPEELAFVELIPQNREANTIKSISGRAMNHSFNVMQSEVIQTDTIFCVSGFLLNMLEKSIKLVSPCPASQQWPNGYIVFDQAIFKSTNNLKEIIFSMISRFMYKNIQPNTKYTLRPDIFYHELSNSFTLSTPYSHFIYEGKSEFNCIVTLLKGRQMSLQELVTIGKAMGHEVSTIEQLMEELFRYGLLKDVNNERDQRDLSIKT
jgi:radical SAM family RiPP maturation amino acid epimerase